MPRNEYGLMIDYRRDCREPVDALVMRDLLYARPKSASSDGC